jgi:alpha-glucosidase (family GH31 glycosyl hydrolase)
MREAMYDALNPSMSFGYGPWNLGKRTNNICLQAAQLHDRLQPYFYSNAIKAYKTGFPYPLTPLPLVFPHDKNVYGLADTTRRSYEWMIGESLLATPLYGNDYATAKSRDVYLPKGKWMDYETGKVYKGPKTLTNFELPVNKIPLFVGGKGIIVIQKNKQLFVRIYPVTNQSKIAFYDKDGKTKSRISIDHPDWKNVSVQDLTDNQSIDVKHVHHAYEFLLEPGHDYRIK